MGQDSGLRVCGVFREEQVQLKRKDPMRRGGAMSVATLPIFPEETEFKINIKQKKTKPQNVKVLLEIYFL